MDFFSNFCTYIHGNIILWNYAVIIQEEEAL